MVDMTTALHQYANKVYGEHPIALWPMDEEAYYLSLVDDNDRLLTNWTNGGNDRVNRVLNPSFETGTNSWGFNASASIARITTDAYIGSACLEVTKAAVVNSGAFTIIDPVLPNQTYTFSVYMKVPAGQQTATNLGIEIDWITSGGSFISASVGTARSLTSADGWTRFSVTGTAPATAGKCNLYMIQYTAGTAGQKFLVDAVLFERTSTVGTYFDGSYGGGAWVGAASVTESVIHVKDRVNLVPNPSVEVNVAGWNGNNTSSVVRSTAQFIGGSASALATYNTLGTGGAGIFWWEAAGTGPGYLVTAGKAYTFSVYVRSNTETRSYSPTITWRDSDTAAGNVVSTTTGTSVSCTLNTWARVTVTGIAPVGAKSAVISVYTTTATTAGNSAYFDSAMFEESDIAYPYFDPTWSTVSYGGLTYSFTSSWAGTAHASQSTLTWSTKSNSPTLPATPSPFEDDIYSAVTRSTPLPGVVDIQSPQTFSLSDVNLDAGKFTINLFLYQNPTYINWFKVGYRYLNAGGVLQEVISDEIPAPALSSWINLNQTYDLPSSWSGSARVFIQINYKDSTSGDAAARTVIMNGLSVGQNSITTCYESLGTTAVDLPADTGIALKGVSADQHGVLADNGYYVVRNNVLLSHNDALPIIFGTDNSTSIDPGGAGFPSFIFPGKGMLNEQGRNKQYTLELWMKLDPASASALRILGPVNSTNGVYVKEGFITLAIGGEIGSHFVGDWYRPMLVHVSLKDSNATLMINGEQVINIPFDRKTIDLPDTNDWWGIYSYDTISYFNVDCISILPYPISEMAAKRRFVYGQGTPSIQSIDNSYQGTATTIEFPTAEYNANIIYPDIARWDAGYFNNLTATKDYLSVPDYKLPNIFLSGRDLKEWYDANLTVNASEYPANDHPNFITFRPNQVTRTNLITNPSFETNTTGWAAIAGATISRVAGGVSGGFCLQVINTVTLGDGARTVDIPVQAGKVYRAEAMVRMAAGQSNQYMDIYGAWYNESAVNIGTTEFSEVPSPSTYEQTVTNAGWSKFYGWATAPAGAVNFRLMVRGLTGAVRTYLVDNVILEEVASVGLSRGDYFDGSYVSTTIKPIGVQAWNGTAHASTSTVTTWNPNGINYQDPSYFNFQTLNILNDQIAAVYGVFEIESDIATTRPLMSFVNVTNGDKFNISVNSDEVTYWINDTPLHTDVITIGTENAVGINFDAAGTAFGYDVSRFFSSPSSIQLYIGGDGIDTFEGKIYAVGLCNDVNYSRLNPSGDPNFDSNGIALDANYARFLDHFASYTLTAEREYGELFLDIAVQSEWEEYFPLSYFASYVKDEDGNPKYDIDMLQVNIGYPTVISTAVWNYQDLKTEFTTPNDYADLRDSVYLDYFGLQKRNASGSTAAATSAMKSYISFQSLASGANTPLDSITYEAGLTDDNVIYPDRSTFPYDTKYAFKDNAIVFPPKDNFEDYAMVVHLQINQRSILKNPLKIKSLEISSKNFNEVSATDDASQRPYLGTKFGKKAFPVINALTNLDYKSQNPFFTHKSSTPYLYNTKKSGIRMVGESNIVQSPAESYTVIPINESGAFDYKVAAMQFMVKPEFLEDGETIKFIEIKHKDGYLLYALDKIGGSATMSVYEKFGEDVYLNGNSPTEPTWDYVYDGGTPFSVFPQVPYLDIQTPVTETGTPVESPYVAVYGTDFYQNGRYVQTPVLDNNEWAMIGIVFPDQLDFSEYQDGGIRLYGGGVFNNVSYYLAEGLGTTTDLTTRTWQSVFDVDGTVPSGTVWSYWTGSTWQYVYVLGQVSSYVSTPAGIYDAYVGTNAEIIDDGLGMSLNHRQAQIVSGATWSTYTKKPA